MYSGLKKYWHIQFSCNIFVETNDNIVAKSVFTCRVAIFNNEFYDSGTNNVKIQESRTEYF